MKARHRTPAPADGLGLLLLALAVLSSLGFGGGCGPHEGLPDGILPMLVSYEPTHATSGTSTTTGTALSITKIEPTSPTAGTTVTITGTGFGTNAKLLGFNYPAAAVSATVISATKPELTPVEYVSPVSEATSTQLKVRLPTDIISRSVTIGILATPWSTTSGSQSVTLVKVSNAVTLLVRPRVVGLYAGVIAGGSPFSLVATGLSPKLSENKVRFLASSGQEVGIVGATSVGFSPGLNSLLDATVPSSVTTSIAQVVLDVAGRKSTAFP